MIKEKKYKMKSPETLTIKEFQRYMEINKIDDDIEKAIQLVCFFYDLKEDKVLAMKKSEFENLIRNININDVKMPENTGLPYVLKVGDTKFKVAQTMQDMCLAQFIDWQTTIAKMIDEKKTEVDMLDRFTCCFLFTYDTLQKKYVYKSFDVLDLVGDLPFREAYRIFVFFYLLKDKLKNLTQKYLADKEKQMMKAELQTASELRKMTEILNKK